MIIGAGMAGLIAAHVFPRDEIIDAAPGPRESHKALLRFRTPAVSELTGIPFESVTIHKGIFMDGKFHEPNIMLANLYSMKVVGSIIDRSIWNIKSETRYIAPENFYERLYLACSDRVKWNTRANFLDCKSYKISTAPMPIVLRAMNLDSGLQFKRTPITVKRYRIPRCNVHQTVYFPTRQHSLYRASITGDMLICEFAANEVGPWESELVDALNIPEMELLETAKQDVGKIAPVNDHIRRKIIITLTDDYGIYSLGRFAVWRNILLDDVVKDAAVIKRLITESSYERKITKSKFII